MGSIPIDSPPVQMNGLGSQNGKFKVLASTDQIKVKLFTHSIKELKFRQSTSENVKA